MRSKKILVVAGMLVIGAIAFFLITTSMSTPEPVTIDTPATKGITVDAKSDHTVSLWLLPGNKFYAYKGSNYKAGKNYDYTAIKDFLMQERKNDSDSLFVIIGKSKYASYKNTVDVLDEMTINNIKQYTLRELSKEEENLIENINQNN